MEINNEDQKQQKLVDPQKILEKIDKAKFEAIKKKLPLILGGILGLIIIIVVIAKTSSIIRNSKLPAASPSPQPTTEPELASPSAYASDSAVLKIEGTLAEIEKLLQQIKFREPSLLPPQVDLNVVFNVTE